MIVRALNKLGVRSDIFWRPMPDYGPNRVRFRLATEKLAQRVIECHIQARYPVILGVGPHEWFQLKRTADPNIGKVGHAVTVVGVRKASIQKRKTQFILHDPAKQPFVERSADFCFNACWANSSKHPGILMILPREHTVTRSLWSCLEYMIQNNAQQIQFFLGFGLDMPRPFRHIWPFDYQFSLLFQKDLHTFLWPVPLLSKERLSLRKQLKLHHSRYWAIAVYQNQYLKTAWLFPANGQADSAWELRIYRNERHQYIIDRGQGITTCLKLSQRLARVLQELYGTVN